MKHSDPDSPAFPTPSVYCDPCHVQVDGGAEGMTVREYLAAKALPGILVAQVCTGIGMGEAAEGLNRMLTPEAAATLAFRYADALIAEARKGQAASEAEDAKKELALARQWLWGDGPLGGV